ncbi:MAG: hypothetical protein EOO85_24670 [Pedobacter sp.]|nr:MAG: hypothetical protein EOO85_24670 [Pedobacter sp.]
MALLVNKTENTFLSNKVKRMVFVPFAFVLFYLVSFLLDPYAKFWQEYSQRNFWNLLAEWCTSLVFCFLVSEASIFIHAKLNHSLPWTDRPLKRLVVEALFNMLAVMFIIFLNIVFIICIEKEDLSAPSAEDIKNLMQWGVVSMMISFMIIAINTGSYLVSNWKNSEMKVTEHKLREAELRQASVDGSGIIFDIDVAPQSKALYLPPLTLQLLIENAIKHNSTHKNNPLTIKIYTKEAQILVVENSLALIENQNLRSFGIGLPNIMSRFELLKGRAPEIIKTSTTYKVVVHLMDYEQ